MEPVKHGGCYGCGTKAPAVLMSVSDVNVLAAVKKKHGKDSGGMALALCPDCRKLRV